MYWSIDDEDTKNKNKNKNKKDGFFSLDKIFNHPFQLEKFIRYKASNSFLKKRFH